MILQASGKAFVVGAIDFGTTNSGWAYSFGHEFKKEPANANVRHWNAGTGALLTEKTPTCALISPDGTTLEEFGYDAENKFMDLVEQDDHRDYYYFRRFKMFLNKEVGSSLTMGNYFSVSWNKEVYVASKIKGTTTFSGGLKRHG